MAIAPIKAAQNSELDKKTCGTKRQILPPPVLL
jgi:hypothetical protein